MEALRAIYSEPLFLTFAFGSVMVSTLAFGLFAGPLTAIAAWDPERLRRYRIQRRRPRRQNIVAAATRTWLVNNLWLLLAVVAAWPLLRLSAVHAGPLPPVWVVALQVLFFIYLDDFIYYWFHRTMHRPWLFKRIHGWHHRIITPWAITGHYMHPIEYVLTGTIALIGPLLLGAHVVTLWVWFAFRQWEAAEGHCGYDFPWSPTHLLPFHDGAVHHDVHHERVRGNYAGFLAYLDGLFGTYSRDYEPELRHRRGWSAPQIA